MSVPEYDSSSEQQQQRMDQRCMVAVVAGRMGMGLWWTVAACHHITYLSSPHSLHGDNDRQHQACEVFLKN